MSNLPDGVTLSGASASHGDGNAYAVYLHGQYVGEVRSARYTASVPTGRGGRLRRVVGHPVRWRYALDPALHHAREDALIERGLIERGDLRGSHKYLTRREAIEGMLAMVGPLPTTSREA